jgi:hypothetical protein
MIVAKKQWHQSGLLVCTALALLLSLPGGLPAQTDTLTIPPPPPGAPVLLNGASDRSRPGNAPQQ